MVNDLIPYPMDLVVEQRGVQKRTWSKEAIEAWQEHFDVLLLRAITETDKDGPVASA